MPMDSMQNFKFAVHNSIPALANMYISVDNVLEAAGVPCAQVGTYVNGALDLIQEGKTAIYQVTNLQQISILNGILP